jgi:hypothetical protein
MCNPPRVNFCWWCGKKLRGRNHVHAEIDGTDRIMHKFCEKYRPEEAARKPVLNQIRASRW